VARPGYNWDDSHLTPEIRSRIINLRGRQPETISASINEENCHIYATDAVQQDVSATAIRVAAKAGKRAEWLPLVAPAVAGYIDKYGLYE
jgi:nicotinic acid mononucleotide adenylyltransferase